MTHADALIKAEKERPKLVNFISKLFGSYEDAEDVVQDVFYQLIDKFDDLSTINNLTGWLYRAAKNKAIDQTRKKKPDLYEDFSSQKNDDLRLENILPKFGNSPEDELMSKAIAEELELALEELPPEQKEAFVLHEFEDIPFSEMSEMLGIAVNTLISRKRYALLYLRERLKNLYNSLND